jgi:hypothetical protein
MQKNQTLPKGRNRCRFNIIMERIHGKSFRGNNWRAAVGCHHKPERTITVTVAKGNFEDCNRERDPADLEQKAMRFGQMIIKFSLFPFSILMFQKFRICQTPGILPIYFQSFL